MYIKKDAYFTVKEDTAQTINITFSIRKKSISNIARLYDDAMPSRYDEADRYVAEIHFHYRYHADFCISHIKDCKRYDYTDTISYSPEYEYILHPEDSISCGLSIGVTKGYGLRAFNDDGYAVLHSKDPETTEQYHHSTPTAPYPTESPHCC